MKQSDRSLSLCKVPAMTQDKILILDFGSQVTQLIARRVREAHVYCELHSFDMPLDEIKAFNPKGIILSGGPNSVYESDYQADTGIFDLGIPVLGICYGMQFMAHHLGGEVQPGNQREFGYAQVKTIDSELTRDIYDDTPNTLDVWMSHGNKVSKLPNGFAVIGDTPSCPIAMMENVEKQFYGIQFHPEVTHTKQGRALLNRFVLDICGAQPSWTMPNYIEEAVAKIREQVGSDEVILGLSGGVDSSVAAALIHRAIGDQLTCVFVDHGLLRKGEGDQVMDSLAGKFGLNIIRVNAKDRFLSKLAGVSDPEQKRKIIGNEFVYVFDDEAAKLEGVDFLAQGTLYTDIIESGTKTAETIKSHHNVGGLPEDMQFELIEPLNTLFKDEVRALGAALGMPDSLVWRQPFPGPGLGIRVIGEITEEKLEIVRESDAILREEIANHGLNRDVWQYFTVLPGFKSVGVMGDGRTYDYTVGIRAVTSIDGMTSDFARLPWEVLQVISARIVNEVAHVNRVVYDITSKPPATIEWE